jgi:hypothetical protein
MSEGWASEDPPPAAALILFAPDHLPPDGRSPSCQTRLLLLEQNACPLFFTHPARCLKTNDQLQPCTIYTLPKMIYVKRFSRHDVFAVSSTIIILSALDQRSFHVLLVFSIPTNNRVHKIMWFQFWAGLTNKNTQEFYPGSGLSVEVIAICPTV